MGELTMRRDAPGITPLHLAGLCGLYLTLEAFRSRPQLASPLIAGDYNDDAIVLRWDGQDGPAFRDLMAHTYVHDSAVGLFDAPGLGPLTNEGRARLYATLVDTFVQHPRTRAPDKKLGRRLLNLDTVGDGLVMPFPYTALLDFAHRSAFVPGGAFVDKLDRLRRSARIVGWLFPGGGVRHQIFSETELQEPVDRAITLAFAPLGALFFRLSSAISDKRVRSALVLPFQNPLSVLAAVRKIAADVDVHGQSIRGYAAGASDAVLQYELAVAAQQETAAAGGCEAICFGSVAWNAQQRSRTRVIRIARVPNNLDLYDALTEALPQRVSIRSSDGIGFVSLSPLREFVARNIVRGDRWYAGFAAFLRVLQADPKSPYRRGFFKEEKGALHMIVTRRDWNEEEELAFVRTFHQAMRQRYGQLAQRAREGNSDFGRLIEVESVRMRVALAKAKTVDDFTHAIAEILSRAGPNPVLRKDFRSVMRMLTRNSWARARDLALLALVSYAGDASKAAEAPVTESEITAQYEDTMEIDSL